MDADARDAASFRNLRELVECNGRPIDLWRDKAGWNVVCGKGHFVRRTLGAALRAAHKEAGLG